MPNETKALLAYDLTSADLAHAVLSAMAQAGMSPTPEQATAIAGGIMEHLDTLWNTRSRPDRLE